VWANHKPLTAGVSDFENWINTEYQISIDKMFANFSRPDTVRGTIVAAPSQENPNYYYHWVRDASVAIGTVFKLLNRESNEHQKKYYEEHIRNFVEITKIHQSQKTSVGLGEVKFLPTGMAYLGPWMRPQNDGPAIRAIVLSFYAQYLLNRGEVDYVRKNLYSGEWPAFTLIKTDLEYVSHHWQEPSFDIWEEVYGDHFFNRYVQAEALRIGADLAERINDQGAANWYRMQRLKIISTLEQFWNPKKLQIDATKNYQNNRGKESNLDVAVVLAVMAIGCGCNHHFGVIDDRVIATAWKLIEAFQPIYKINQNYSNLAPAIGRYIEDAYDGYVSPSVGNPWFLTTAALASFSYRLAWNMKKEGRIEITANNNAFFKYAASKNKKLLAEINIGKTLTSENKVFAELFEATFVLGDSFLERMRFHMGRDGSMAEQFHRDTGFMQGAPELTMNYTAFVRAIFSRQNVLPF
jgi:glucoamylase